MAKILLVDDDLTTLSALELLLKLDGHHVFACSNAKAAIDAARAATYDVVLTDLEMPNVDGRAVVRAVRAITPRACIGVITAATSPPTDDLRACGACFVLAKPLHFEGLLRELQACAPRHVDRG